MKNFKMQFILTALFSFFFIGMQAQTSFSAIRTAPQSSFNYSVKDLKLVKSRTGKKVLKMNIGLDVFDKGNDRLNMNFDLIIMVNGKIKKRISNNVSKGGAITCAVTCAGKCPSIFGDGICGGCSCSYDNWLSSSLGEMYNGDVIQVKIVPARGGQKDKSGRDNSKRMVVRGR